MDRSLLDSYPPSMLEARIRKTYSLFERGLDYHRQFLDRYLPEAGLIADVGCGECRVGWFYQSAVRHFIGFDLDENTIAAARELGAPQLVKADAFALPVESESLDGYIGLGIWEFDQARGHRGAGEAARALKADGLLYVTIPFRNWRRRLGFRANWHGNEVQSFSEPEVCSLLKEHGFELILLRRSSLAYGIGPIRKVARFMPNLLVREKEDSLSYRLFSPILKPHANSLLAIARKE